MNGVPSTQFEDSSKGHPLKLSQVVQSLAGLDDAWGDPLAVAQQILAWTNSQPELTQYLVEKVMDAASQSSGQPVTLTPLELVNSQVKAYFSPDLLISQPSDETHAVGRLLTGIKDVLLEDRKRGCRRLQYYQTVLITPHQLPSGYQSEETILLDVGLLHRNSEGRVKITNPIYRRVFNADWVDQQLNRPFVMNKGHWILLTSLLSILAFIWLQSVFRYAPLSRTYRCNQAADLRDAIVAKLSLEPLKMRQAMNRLLILKDKGQLSEQCQSILYDLQYSYGIYVAAGTHNHPLDAVTYLCQIPESYYIERNSVPWFSRWSNIYNSINFAESLTAYVERNSCPGYTFLNRVSP